MFSQQEELLDISPSEPPILPPPPPPPQYGPDQYTLPDLSDVVLPNDPCDTIPTDTSQFQNTTKTLTISDRIDNIVIGTAYGLYVGGSAVLIGGAVACVAGSASVIVPILEITGKQAFAWGLLAHNVVPIFVAPFLGIEMEVLEYPS